MHPAAHFNAVLLLVLLATLSVAMLAVAPFALTGGRGPGPVVGPQIVAFSVVFGALGVVAALLWLALGIRMVAQTMPSARLPQSAGRPEEGSEPPSDICDGF